MSIPDVLKIRTVCDLDYMTESILVHGVKIISDRKKYRSCKHAVIDKLRKRVNVCVTHKNSGKGFDGKLRLIWFNKSDLGRIAW